MVGHSLLVFAAVAFAVSRLDATTRRSLMLGGFAAMFALVPDVDMLYAVFGAIDSGFTGVWTTVEGFWNASTFTHRGATHSLLVAVPAATGFALMASRKHGFRLISGFLLLALAAIAFLAGGVLSGAVVLLFVGAGAFVGYLAGTRDITPKTAFVLAFVGLASHPFGDLFTGDPPAFLYPLDVALVADRVTLVAEPTLNLVAVFLLEIMVIWLAVLVYGDLTGRRLTGELDPKVAVGLGYAAAVLVLPPPTLQESYQFVFSVLGLGVLSGVSSPGWRSWRPDLYRAFVTGLGVVTVALLAYAAVYAAV